MPVQGKGGRTRASLIISLSFVLQEAVILSREAAICLVAIRWVMRAGARLLWAKSPRCAWAVRRGAARQHCSCAHHPHPPTPSLLHPLPTALQRDVDRARAAKRAGGKGTPVSKPMATAHVPNQRAASLCGRALASRLVKPT
jgi:hypothetical protein